MLVKYGRIAEEFQENKEDTVSLQELQKESEQLVQEFIELMDSVD